MSRRILLDTHAILWWLARDSTLPPSATELIEDPEIEANVSVASVWEIGIKRAVGKLQAPKSLVETISSEGFEWLSIEPRHAWAVGDLPRHHNDPFDRMLIAQALDGDLEVITRDPHFNAYGVRVRWSE